MSKHVFVSHSHKDSAAANSVVTALEKRGIHCWIAPRDVTPGGSYAESILSAIEGASCFVLIYSEHSNVSSHVLREVERALTFGVNIVPVRLDDSTPSKSLDYLLATVHWLAIPAASRDQSIARAAEQIAEWLTNFMRNPAAPLPVRQSALQTALVTALEPPRKRGGMLVGAAILLGLIAGAAALATGHIPLPRKPEPNPTALNGTRPASTKTAIASAPFKPGSLKPTPTPSGNHTIGYAGVSPANPPMPPPNEQRMQNARGMYPPPPPNGDRADSDSNGAYPPPPPPGAPIFGPPRGPGPGMPPPNRGPRQ